MDEQTVSWIVIGIIIIVGLAMISGAIKTFKRNWLLALLMLIFLFPLWLIWAFIEIFTGEIRGENSTPQSVSQNVTVTLVNQTDGSTNKLVELDGMGQKRIVGILDNRTQLLDGPVSLYESAPPPASITEKAGDSKICPFCAETIKLNAIVCRYCNRELQAPK